ncbi:MAG: D-alanyl-D-alanine carboxypeptidase family protein [Oscillospiraceae bacterium]|nr:D-alanyl-D-alanine carboxypeptidase family protein [Oscillospiraceae bacterium]
MKRILIAVMAVVMCAFSAFQAAAETVEQFEESGAQTKENQDIPPKPPKRTPPPWELTISEADSAIVVSWSGIRQADSYYIYRAETANDSLKLIGKTQARRFVDSDIRANRLYQYAVSAIADDGDETTVLRRSEKKFGALNALETPVLSAVAPSPGGNVIEWQSVNAAYDYSVHKSTHSDGGFKPIGTTRELSFTDNTVENGEIVYYAVRARLFAPEYMSRGSNVMSVRSHRADNQWAYLLISKAQPLPENYLKGIKFEPVRDDFRMDSRCAEYARQMLAAGTSAGGRFSVLSAYRSPEQQQRAIDNQFRFLRGKGHSHEDALALTLSEILPPGASEHNAGLAIDITTTNWYDYNDDITPAFANTWEAQWLAANAHRFGFILRYPDGKEDITGITFEPWHFRFVGLYTAKQIKNSGLTLEEFMADN